MSALPGHSPDVVVPPVQVDVARHTPRTPAGVVHRDEVELATGGGATGGGAFGGGGATGTALGAATGGATGGAVVVVGKPSHGARLSADSVAGP